MKRELALHTDKYQINMMYAHWVNGSHKRKAVFEAYFRKLPFGNGYAVFAGLERIVGYIGGLRFTEDDIRYLSEQEENYAPAFLEELLQFHFQGNVYSMKEGALIFPDEPLIRVEGTIMEAQLVETAILNFMNYQTLIATKASRIKQVAPNDILLSLVPVGHKKRMRRSGALERPISAALMQPPTCWQVKCLASLPKVHMLILGFRASAVSRKLLMLMPR